MFGHRHRADFPKLLGSADPLQRRKRLGDGFLAGGPKQEPFRRMLPAMIWLWLASTVAGPAQTIVSTSSVWRYLADGSGQTTTNWRGAVFDDSEWGVGRAPLGFGDDDHATVIATGAGPMACYFRHRFDVADWRANRTLTLRVRRDDGVVVYLNNREVRRDNMPSGPVLPSTPALRSVVGEEEYRFVQFGLAPFLLVTGTNMLAVELHQTENGRRDGSFDLELLANRPLGPPEVRWITPEDGEVLPGGPVLLLAEANDVDGHVGWVEFYENDALLGTVSSAPFALAWSALAGRYRLRAEAIDYSGRRSLSRTVHVQVGPTLEDRLVRGPYLQSGSTNSMVVCWRTDWFTEGRVLYGLNPFEFGNEARGALSSTDHAVRIDGLQPDTKYYYAIGTADSILASGADYSFVTAPIAAKPTRIWVIGDAGTADDFQRLVRDAYDRYANGTATDLWLMLGDNAYECGTDAEYQAAVFEMYPELLRRVVLWPTIGNHDAGCFGNANFPYLDIFSLPAQGEAGGVASGTERYYSFDYGNLHFVCLDAQSSSRLTGGPMLTWLEQDLAATDKDWIIAYWHQPPYSFGTHDSDREHDLIEMRQHAVPILEKHGVDLVLCGHSHNYERSYLLNGHYGFASNSVSESFILDQGFGREELDQAYQKPAGGLGAHRGTVYAVCGCSGQGGYFSIRQHPAMRVSLTGFGSMIIDVDGLRLDARFLTETGQIADFFTIKKGVPGQEQRPTLRIVPVGSQARISWPTSLMPFQLEATAQLNESSGWAEVRPAPVTIGRRHQVTVDRAKSQQIYRLKQAPR